VATAGSAVAAALNGSSLRGRTIRVEKWAVAAHPKKLFVHHLEPGTTRNELKRAFVAAGVTVASAYVDTRRTFG
jgi:hypothetical protein